MRCAQSARLCAGLRSNTSRGAHKGLARAARGRWLTAQLCSGAPAVEQQHRGGRAPYCGRGGAGRAQSARVAAAGAASLEAQRCAQGGSDTAQAQAFERSSACGGGNRRVQAGTCDEAKGREGARCKEHRANATRDEEVLRRCSLRTRRVRLVRGVGRGVSDQYEGRGGRGGGAPVQPAPPARNVGRRGRVLAGRGCGGARVRREAPFGRSMRVGVPPPLPYYLDTSRPSFRTN